MNGQSQQTQQKTYLKTKAARDPEEKDGLFYYLWNMKFSNKLDAKFPNQNSNKNQQTQQQYSNHVEIKEQIIDHECLLKQKKTIRLMICVTIYSEPCEQLWETLDGIHANLEYFTKFGICNEDIAVVVLFDGIDKMHPTCAAYFNDIESLNEVPSDRRLKKRKEQFLKSQSRENENELTSEREKELTVKIQTLQKQIVQYHKQQKQTDTFQMSDAEYFTKRIQPCMGLFIQKLQDEKEVPIVNRDEYIDKRITEFQEDLLRLLKQKKEQFKDTIQDEYKNYPTNSSYMYSIPYVPAKRCGNTKQKQSQNQKGQQKNSYNMMKDEGESEERQNTLTVFFTVKLKNGGKLSSHMWFFRGFCEMFQPKYCALVDCGTIPDKESIFKFFRAMEVDPQIGGVCGYMGLVVENIMDPETKQRLDKNQYPQYDPLTQIMLNFFCVQKAQRFEYAIAHILDKSLESLFGFIQVLPGAFSAYRWDSIKKENEDDNILDKEYLVSALDNDFQTRKDYTVQKANMFLAEDRILCLEIFTRKKKNYILKYLPDARCRTDAIISFINLMSQRRRWINGSWFALMKVAFSFIMILIRFNVMLSYFAIALYFIFLNMFCSSLSDHKIDAIGPAANLYVLALFIYSLGIGSLFFFSLLCKNPNHRIQAFSFISTCLGIFMISSFGFYIGKAINILDEANAVKLKNVNSIEHLNLFLMKYLIGINILSYFFPIMFYGMRSFTDVFINLKDYLYYSPAYMHTLLIYAFCNVHDMSWGTKGSDSSSNKTEEVEKRFHDYRIGFLGWYISLNLFFMFVFCVANGSSKTKNYFLFISAVFFTFTIGIKGLASIIYSIKYIFTKRHYENKMETMKSTYEEESEIMRQLFNDNFMKMRRNANERKASQWSRTNSFNLQVQQMNQIPNLQYKQNSANLNTEIQTAKFRQTAKFNSQQ